MREYVFLLEYDYGVHPIRDAFIDHPDVVATALTVSITHDSGWRVERLTGPEDALDAVESVYYDEECNDCAYPTPVCDAKLGYEVLEREPTARTIYRHGIDVSYCSSLGYLALKSLGNGLVFDAAQRGPYYEWRILVPSERNVDVFHRSIDEELPEGISLDVRRTGTPERWLRARRPQPGADLSYEQREAIETAWRLGYYDHPRAATLEDVAAHLDLPTTTFRYRLRRAEAWATATALGDGTLDVAGPAPLERTDHRSEAPVSADDDP